MMRIIASAALAVLLPAGATAAPPPPAGGYVVVNEAVGVPVFPNDITDRPYEVIGPVRAGVRKATLFSNEASQAKLYRELWERARRMGADAVVKVSYGNAHVTAFSWGQTNVEGTAIRFTTPATPSTPAK